MLPQVLADEKSGRVRAYYEGKQVLVTGGAGFIGGNMAKNLVDMGANVTVVDLRCGPDVPSILNDPALELPSKIKFIEGDISDFPFIQDVIHSGNFHFIFNFAAYATVIEKAVEGPYATVQSNTLGLVNILEAVRTLKLRPTRVFHASTDKVYGEMDGEPYEEERTPLRGIGVYDSAKLAADVFARTYHEVFGVPSVVLRMCNIFGPGDFNTGYRLIPRAMSHLYEYDDPIGPELYFDAIEHHRDYLYVDDCIRAILLLGYVHQCRGEVFNLTAAKFTSTPELLKTLVQIAYRVEREFDPHRAEQILSQGISVKVRPGNTSVVTIKKQHLNGDKITRVTGFEPAVEFEEGLERTIRAYRSYFRGAGAKIG